jgi:chemotaxis protein MotB
MNADYDHSAAPAWMLTFGDLMALLLTFFVLLVSMSEMKRDDRFQGIADSLGQQFGAAAAGGETSLRPRHSGLAAVLHAGRLERIAAWQKPAPEPAAAKSPQHLGDLAFAAGTWELTDDHRQQLRLWLSTVVEPATTVELRISAEPQPNATNDVVRDAWDIAYLRGRRVRQFLVEELAFAAEQVRLTIGPSSVAFERSSVVAVHVGRSE